MNDLGELAAPVVYERRRLHRINAKVDLRDRYRDRPPGLAHAGPESSRRLQARRRSIAARPRSTTTSSSASPSTITSSPSSSRPAACSGTRSSPKWQGYHSSGAPIVANGVLISSVGGGKVDDTRLPRWLGSATGEKLWRRCTIRRPAKARFEDLAGQQRRALEVRRRLDLALELRSAARSRLLGRRQLGAYDPRPREGRDSLLTDSVIAIPAQDRRDRLYFQYTPNDVYDVANSTDEEVLDMPIDGQMRR